MAEKSSEENLTAEAEDPKEEASPLEVLVGPEKEEEKPDVVTMTSEEFAALKASSDSARAVREGIEGLSAKLGQPQVVQQAPVNGPQQTPEEYFAEHSDEMFDKEKGAKVFETYSKMISERNYGPTLRGLSTKLANMSKERLEEKDPHFKKYKAEVDALVAQQPPDVRLAPDIYERAWLAVRQNHQAEIEADNVASQVATAVDKKLKELGIDPTKLATTSGRPAAHVGSEGRSTPSVSTTERKRSVRLPDAATEQKLRAEAMRKGMDFEDLLRQRGYIS